MENWEKINAVYRMQIYIENHITESITLCMIANEAGYSPWHSTRIFKEAMYEPIGMWMPETLLKSGTSVYTQGVEVPANYTGEVPEGFDLIDLKPCKMMVF